MLAILAASGSGWLRVGPRDPLSQFPLPRARRVAGFEAQPQTCTKRGPRMATPRYALRLECFDGTLEPPYHSMTNRAEAIRTARRHAREETAPDVMRVWVDDSAAGQAICAFATPQATEDFPTVRP